MLLKHRRPLLLHIPEYRRPIRGRLLCACATEVLLPILLDRG
jgi:hypothetical protein